MNKIYCNYCGKMHKENELKCKKCNRDLNPKNELWKEYIYNHIKDELKDNITDNIISLIKNFIISNWYGSIMTVLIFTTTIIGTVAYIDNHPGYIKNVSVKNEISTENVSSSDLKHTPVKSKDLITFMKNYAESNTNVINDHNASRTGYLSLFIADADDDGEEEGFILHVEPDISWLSLVKKVDGQYQFTSSYQFDDLSYLNSDNFNVYLFAKKEGNKTAIFVEQHGFNLSYTYVGIDQYIVEGDQITNRKSYSNLQLAEFNDELKRDHGIFITDPKQSVYKQNQDKTILIFSKEYNNGTITFKNNVTAEDFGIGN